jgi:hypothetical protein
MEGKMSFVYMPVRDMKQALRDQLGLDEAWREGNGTVVFKLPGTEIELMLDLVDENSQATAGPAFIIPSVDEFYAAQEGKLAFAHKPIDIHPGRQVTVLDTSGNMLHLFDMSKMGQGG